MSVLIPNQFFHFPSATLIRQSAPWLAIGNLMVGTFLTLMIKTLLLLLWKQSPITALYTIAPVMTSTGLEHGLKAYCSAHPPGAQSPSSLLQLCPQLKVSPSVLWLCSSSRVLSNCLTQHSSLVCQSHSSWASQSPYWPALWRALLWTYWFWADRLLNDPRHAASSRKASHDILAFCLSNLAARAGLSFLSAIQSVVPVAEADNEHFFCPQKFK